MRTPTRQAVIGLTVLGALVRFGTLDLQSFEYDETFTVFLVRMDLGGMLSTIPDTEATPPLYYVLAWLWSQAFGTGEVGLRSLSTLLGTALVPLAYAAGATLVSRRVGLVVAALVTVNPYLIWMAQEARSYSLMLVLSTLSFIFFLRAADGRDGARDVLWWAVAAGLGAKVSTVNVMTLTRDGGQPQVPAATAGFHPGRPLVKASYTLERFSVDESVSVTPAALRARRPSAAGVDVLLVPFRGAGTPRRTPAAP